MQRQRISLPHGRENRKNMYKQPSFCGEGKWKNLLPYSVLHRKSSEDVSNSNSEQAAKYSYSRLSTIARNCKDLRLILDERKNCGRTTATARANMDESASLAAPPETNNKATHQNCVDEMSPEIFLRQASQKMDTLEVTEKHFQVLTDIAYKATLLCMQIKEKKAEDFKRDVNAHTLIPGLTLIEQAYSSLAAEPEFLQEAEDTELKECRALSIEQASISTIDKTFVKESRNKLCNESSTTSIATQTNEPLISFEIIKEAEQLLQEYIGKKKANESIA